MSEGLSPATLTTIGAAAGIVEVFVCQPLVACKNALQDSRPLPRAPREFYRGVVINSTSFAPITAVQFGVNRFMEKMILGSGEGGKKKMTSVEKVVASTIAGAASGLVSGPAELVMIQQQKNKTKLMEQASLLMREHGIGIFARGLIPNMTREAIYTVGYLGLCPIFYGALSSTETFKENKGAAYVVSGIAAGMCSSTSSQPADTIKTRLQSNIGQTAEKDGYKNIRSTVGTMYKEGGVGIFWSGIAPRMARLVLAVFVLAGCKDFMTAKAEDFYGIERSAGGDEDE